MECIRRLTKATDADAAIDHFAVQRCFGKFSMWMNSCRGRFGKISWFLGRVEAQSTRLREPLFCSNHASPLSLKPRAVFKGLRRLVHYDDRKLLVLLKTLLVELGEKTTVDRI